MSNKEEGSGHITDGEEMAWVEEPVESGYRYVRFIVDTKKPEGFFNMDVFRAEGPKKFMNTDQVWMVPVRVVQDTALPDVYHYDGLDQKRSIEDHWREIFLGLPKEESENQNEDSN